MAPKSQTKKKPSQKKAKSKASSKAEDPPKKRVGKYPNWVIHTKDTVNIDRLKEMYGGALPNFDSKRTKHNYPCHKDEEGWKKLYADALTYRNKSRYCSLNGYEKPAFPKKSMYEYVLVHGRPEMVKDRSKRNIDRRLHGLKKGDKEVVHHTTPDDLGKGYTVRLTFCEHQAVHGKKCNGKK